MLYVVKSNMAAQAAKNPLSFEIAREITFGLKSPSMELRGVGGEQEFRIFLLSLLLWIKNMNHLYTKPLTKFSPFLIPKDILGIISILESFNTEGNSFFVIYKTFIPDLKIYCNKV